MRPTPRALVSLAAATLLVGAATAQDSVSKQPCLPGDGLSPWDDATATNGSEQVNNYVVDMTNVITSWGNRFGLAPIMRSSRSTPQFTGSLLSAQTMSRRVQRNVPFPESSYMTWNGPGKGISNDPAHNDPGTMISTAGLVSTQFAAAFSEFGGMHNGVLGALVNVRRRNPSRLYVKRVVAGINACDDISNMSQFGLGSVDSSGNVFFRADDFGVTGPSNNCPSLTSITGNNIFRVDIDQRDPNGLNVISGDWLTGGAFDKGTSPFITDWLVRNDGNTNNPPNVLPNVPPLMLGSSFGDLYSRGVTFGGITTDSSHIAAGVSTTRGTLSYTTRNHPQLSSTGGIGALIGRDAAGNDVMLNLFGINAAGSVTGTMGLTLPASVFDNSDGYMNQPGLNEFTHSGSQVPFRGGNGQIALGVDQAGNLLAACAVDQPANGGVGNWGQQYIAVAKVTPAGTVSWTMASHNDATTGLPGTGKAFTDGPGGSVLGRLVELLHPTQGNIPGPSCTAPMLDSVGNVWFMAAFERFDSSGGSSFGTGLFRAVYDANVFDYELELVLEAGQKIIGKNSGRTYLITVLPMVDSNSISSSAPWSSNISEDAHLGMSPAGLATSDTKTLGGLVFNAGYLYDWDNDGDFSNCSADPLSDDVSYNALFYLGHPGPLGYHIKDTQPQTGVGRGPPGQ